jgi:hypothetical protein
LKQVEAAENAQGAVAPATIAEQKDGGDGEDSSSAAEHAADRVVMLVDVGYASSHAALFRVGSAAHGVELPTVEQLGESTIADGLGVAAVDDILFDSIALKLKEKGECPLTSCTLTILCPHICGVWTVRVCSHFESVVCPRLHALKGMQAQ